MMAFRAHRAVFLGAGISLLSAHCGSPSERAGVTREAVTGGTTDLGDPAVVFVIAGVPVSLGGTGMGSEGTGTIVSPHVVLTAAHIVAPLLSNPNARYYVYTDSNRNMNGGNKAFWPTVREAHVDPAFDARFSASGHDAAVLILDAPTGIPPIPLNRTAPDASWVGQPIRFVGYGIASSTDPTSTAGFLRLQGSSTLGSFGDLFLNTSGGGDGGGGDEPCAGDSGGPGLVTVGGVEVLAGVVSYGDATCSGAALTRVDAELPFVNQWIAQFDAPGDAGIAVDATPDAATTDADGPLPPPPLDGAGLTASDADPGDPGLTAAPAGSGCATAPRGARTAPVAFAAPALLLARRRRREKAQGRRSSLA